MDYIKIKIYTSAQALEILAAELSEVSPYCQLDDPGDIEAELTNAPVKRWDYLGEELFEDMERTPSISLYLDLNEDGELRLSQIKGIIAQLSAENDGFFGSLKLECETVRSEDWENNWKQYYKPFNVGSRLLVRPSWEKLQNPDGRAVLTIDPASSFGTGSHVTTRLCMETLDGMSVDGANVLDMGCGSGILACCAMLLGADRVIACDIEDNAVLATGENLQKNNFSGSSCTVLQGNVLENDDLAEKIMQSGPYDLILANIVADVLIAMAPLMHKMLKPCGSIILSGIIASRRDAVCSEYLALGFKAQAELSSEGWHMILAQK